MDAETRRIAVKCQAALRSLNLPDRFRLDDLLAAISEHRGGRPIIVRAADLSGSMPFGLVLQTATVDTILHPRNTTRLHQRHITIHEAAHALMHLPVPDGTESARGNDLEGMVRRLVPDLHPDLLLPSFRARTTYGDTEEREAEQFATLVQACAARDGGYLPFPRGDREFPAGLRALFDVPACTNDEACV